MSGREKRVTKCFLLGQINRCSAACLAACQRRCSCSCRHISIHNNIMTDTRQRKEMIHGCLPVCECVRERQRQMETDGQTEKSCRKRERRADIYIYRERDSYCQVDRDGKRRQMMGTKRDRWTDNWRKVRGQRNTDGQTCKQEVRTTKKETEWDTDKETGMVWWTELIKTDGEGIEKIKKAKIQNDDESERRHWKMRRTNRWETKQTGWRTDGQIPETDGDGTIPPVI